MMHLRTFAISAGLLFAATACADFERGPRPVVEETDTTVAPSDDTTGSDTTGGNACIDHAPLFEADILPILDNDCALCHAAGGAAGSTGFVLTGSAIDDYSVVAGFIETDDPPSSLLVSKGTGSSHGGGGVWKADDCEVDIITLWIENGAPQ